MRWAKVCRALLLLAWVFLQHRAGAHILQNVGSATLEGVPAAEASALFSAFKKMAQGAGSPEGVVGLYIALAAVEACSLLMAGGEHSRSKAAPMARLAPYISLSLIAMGAYLSLARALAAEALLLLAPMILHQGLENSDERQKASGDRAKEGVEGNDGASLSLSPSPASDELSPRRSEEAAVAPPVSCIIARVLQVLPPLPSIQLYPPVHTSAYITTLVRHTNNMHLCSFKGKGCRPR